MLALTEKELKLHQHILHLYKKIHRKNCSNKTDEKNPFRNTLKFSNNHINKFILLLRKGVCPCEYMNEWEKF